MHTHVIGAPQARQTNTTEVYVIPSVQAPEILADHKSCFIIIIYVLLFSAASASSAISNPCELESPELRRLYGQLPPAAKSCGRLLCPSLDVQEMQTALEKRIEAMKEDLDELRKWKSKCACSASDLLRMVADNAVNDAVAVESQALRVALEATGDALKQSRSLMESQGRLVELAQEISNNRTKQHGSRESGEVLILQALAAEEAALTAEQVRAAGLPDNARCSALLSLCGAAIWLANPAGWRLGLL